MKIYLVGGAIRDRLLGLPVRDRDWVVVGATEAEMLASGFQQVTSGFPVYLHPRSGEEYALARRETKTAPGYRGFSVESGPEVTLEQDLVRRDLTINALAEDTTDGTLIDLFDGQKDLAKGRLRHISPAFVEDPVRLLRVARFAARLGRWGFRVSHGTYGLMQQMAASGELETLQAERVWLEMKQALAEDQPWRFFEVLNQCRALPTLIPELDRTMARGEAHGNPHSCTMTAALRRATVSSDPTVRFTVAMYDAARSAVDRRAFLDGLRAEREFTALLELVIRGAPLYKAATGRDPEQILKLLETLRAMRQPERFQAFLSACHALWPLQGEGFAAMMMEALNAVRSVTGAALAQQGLSGRKLAEVLRQQRLKTVAECLSDYR